MKKEEIINDLHVYENAEKNKEELHKQYLLVIDGKIKPQTFSYLTWMKSGYNLKDVFLQKNPILWEEYQECERKINDVFGKYDAILGAIDGIDYGVDSNNAIEFLRFTVWILKHLE